LILDRRPWLRVWEEDVILPNGLQIPGYLLTEERDYAMVFALTEDGRVPLVKQYKHGLRACATDLPAGYLDDPSEDPLVCAQRELREETGYGGGQWRFLGQLVIDSNRGQTSAHAFLAVGVWLEGPPELDETEAITVHLHTPAEVADMVRQGQISSMASVATVLLALDALRT